MSTAILLIFAGLWIACMVISWQKGKPWFAGLGLMAGIFPLVGAIRLAKPDSIWAYKHYPRDGHQMAEAIRRFPKAADKLEAREETGLLPNPAIKKVF